MSDFGAISYAGAGALYVALCVLLLTSWHGKSLGGYLIAACLASSLWAFLLAAQSAFFSMPFVVVFVLEVLRGGAWLAFLVALLARISLWRRWVYAVHALWLGILVAGIATWLGQTYANWNVSLASVAIPGGLVLALCGLVVIEQLYRNLPTETRWRFKTLVLGVGGLFAYDLFLYSQGMLLGVLDSPTWIARGAVNILFVPLIAIAARRNPDWDLNIFVSRHVVFYTTSLIAIGIYLLLMSLGGYAIVMYGGAWGELARIVFLVGAMLVLVAFLFSSAIRARIRVFLSKHFFRNKYDYREEWLRLISTLSAFEDSTTRQIVIKALAQIVESPSGLMWALEEEQDAYIQIASFNLDHFAADIPSDDPIIHFIRKKTWLIDLREYEEDRSLYDDLEIPAWLTSIEDAWLIVPLMTRQKLLGIVLLTRAPGPPKLNYEDRDLLKTVGNHIAVHLAQDISDNLLAEAQQFEAYNRLTAFLMHDLNNLIAQQSLIIKNAETHKHNPEFVDDVIKTIANSVNRMTGIMQQLKRGATTQATRKAALLPAVQAAVSQCADKAPVPEFRNEGGDVSLEFDRDRLVMVLTHLIRNAQDATPPDGTIKVVLSQADGRVNLVVEDTGCGMSPEFLRERLFRPFDTTKGTRGMGIGAYQAREFARKMGGDVRVDSSPSVGTTITLMLPLAGRPGQRAGRNPVTE